MKKIVAFSLLLFTLFSCKNKDQEILNQQQEITKPLQKDDSNKKGTPKEVINATTASANYKLLQGKWQSTADAKSITEFRNDFKIDTYKGIGETGNSKFMLSDSCTIISNPLKFNHIILTKEQFCYKIIDLDKTTLEISFTGGTQSTLKYKKLSK